MYINVLSYCSGTITGNIDVRNCFYKEGEGQEYEANPTDTVKVLGILFNSKLT